MKPKIKKALLLGSGGLRIGQAGEFDYSGSQAIKALKSEGIETVLVNPNIATVQTDSDMADRVYFEPLTFSMVTAIIARERPQGILLGFGGQTALNLGLMLDARGVLKKYGIAVLGTPISAIRITEDRGLFKETLDCIGLKNPRSKAVTSVAHALHAAKEIGYPLMMRSGFSLGGLGSGKILNAGELKERATEALQAVPQILIEEYLEGWKEIEYEVVRDRDGNVITVCNMENMDPMGIHTGESIVVAPSQTLTNEEYHTLRELALKTTSHLGIVGECNIQFALRPLDRTQSLHPGESFDYRVIEVNARLSRSSALASKATGYPLAFVAAKLALGIRLSELTNSITGTTPAFYEPALDYCAVKIPRWDLAKLKTRDHSIGSEMKSVGEVMALGRSFPEALQKAVRMLNIGAHGLSHHPYTFHNPLREIRHATDQRIFALYDALKRGISVERLYSLSNIDPWFLYHLHEIAILEAQLRQLPLTAPLLRQAKEYGFSDKSIAQCKGLSEETIRQKRIQWKITPYVKQIDTLAGEFEVETNYLYTTYHGTTHDVVPLPRKPVLVIGSGPYCIGSSVEFDWCAVNTAKTLRREGHSTIMVNSNPETVSTDFDRSDRLYFEELTLERLRDIADFEKHRMGIVASVGGQIANTHALPLARAGYHLLGTPAESIDCAEDRKKFSSLLNTLGIDQPEWTTVTTLKEAKKFSLRVQYPVLIRPSYVLSGAAMNVATNERELIHYLQEAAKLSLEHPVVISRFITNAKEFEIDGVAKDGKTVIYAFSEHIENAGVHSGDATVVLPPQKLYLETIRRSKEIAKAIVRALRITGPFNVQFIAKDNAIKVIECNVRASRSFPFVSKVTGNNFIEITTEAILGKKEFPRYQTLELDYVGVKSPQFSYHRLKGADPVAGVEMASTGEVACMGSDLLEAFYLSWLATEQTVRGKRLFLTVSDDHKHKFVDETRLLLNRGWEIFTTQGTHDYLLERGIPTKRLYRLAEKKEPHVSTFIKARGVDLIINVPSSQKHTGDEFKIRRLAIDHHIPILTNAETGALLLRSLGTLSPQKIIPKTAKEFMGQELGTR